MPGWDFIISTSVKSAKFKIFPLLIALSRQQLFMLIPKHLLRYWVGWGLPGTKSNGGSPWGLSGQGPVARACPTPPARSRAAGDTGAAPVPSIGHLHGDRPRPGQGCVPAGGPVSVWPMAGQGRDVESWRLAMLPCCWGWDWQPWGAEMGSWALGRVWGSPGGTGKGQWVLWVSSGPWKSFSKPLLSKSPNF